MRLLSLYMVLQKKSTMTIILWYAHARARFNVCGDLFTAENAPWQLNGEPFLMELYFSGSLPNHLVDTALPDTSTVTGYRAKSGKAHVPVYVVESYDSRL